MKITKELGVNKIFIEVFIYIYNNL